mmetsp:Transcript_19914/g.52173  ORF Transcript_19914/g.52173 Transcript_19914/m.52173 type:complete len:231 (+) Transcript_19914:612-1304(+)
MRRDLQVRGGHRPGDLQHPRQGWLHPRHQRPQQRYHPDVAQLQRDGSLRRPGRWQAQGLLRHVLGALARRRLRLLGAQEEPRQGGAACPRPLLCLVDSGLVHAAGEGQCGLDALLPERGLRRRDGQGLDGRLGRGVRAHVQEVRGRGQGLEDREGAAVVVPHLGVADGDWHPLHALQGPRQSQVQPAELGHDPLLQPLHGDHRVHVAGRGGSVQLGIDRAERVRERGLQL